ncbi:MAG: dipeptide epimerase [Alistipes sp.]|nr:dipeptide epimerase [Alistipes sp.]
MNRREFLKTATTGVVAATVISPWLGGCAPSVTRSQSGRLKLSFQPCDLKLKHPFTVAVNTRTHTPDVQVQLEYDGIIGYGEASMPPYLGENQESVCKFLGSLDLSQFTDPFRMDEILEYVDSVAPNNRAAKASVDLALHDVVGKLLGAPWYKIWGLSPEKTPDTSFTIGIDTPEVVRQKVEETTPYNIIKVKVGVAGDKETIEIIRSMTDKPLCVDANQGWKDKEQALEMIHWLNERNTLFVEQPLPKEMIDETAWLRERSPLPIIADEFLQRLPDIKRAEGVYDGINIKLMKSTGMREAYQMVTLAKALDMKLMIGCMTETSCAVTAAAQLAPLMHWADLDGNLLIEDDPFEGMQIVKGKVTLPDRPGLGVIPIKG